MRRALTLIHRYLGLFAAAFLFVSGVTGAIISWDHEIDDFLNPHLMEAKAQGPALPVLELAKLTEARHPEVRATFFQLAPEPGESLRIGVQPRVNPATGQLYEPGFNQVFVDPATGEELGRRQSGAVWPITSETVVSFLYRLHYTLHVPEIAGTDRWGVWFMGIVAVLWTFDCFVGFCLTLPRKRRPAVAARDDIADDAPVSPTRSFWQRWKPAWKVRWRGGSTKVNFDLHRAFSLWTWGLLFTVAFTGFSLNLYREVFLPAMSLVSTLTPTPFMQRKPTAKNKPIEPKISFADMIEKARAEGKMRGWAEPAGSIFYAQRYGVYGIGFYRPGDDHGAGGVGPARLYYDGTDGRYLGDRQPWKGTAADIFVQAQFPLHSGRILGLPGRILISLMGIVVAMLSITGVVIWWRKRKAREAAHARVAAAIVTRVRARMRSAEA